MPGSSIYRELLRNSFADLNDDFEELKYLIHSSFIHLHQFQKELKANCKNIRPDSYQEVTKNIEFIKIKYEKYLSQLHFLHKQGQTNSYSLDLYNKLIRAKADFFDL